MTSISPENESQQVEAADDQLVEKKERKRT